MILSQFTFIYIAFSIFKIWLSALPPPLRLRKKSLSPRGVRKGGLYGAGSFGGAGPGRGDAVGGLYGAGSFGGAGPGRGNTIGIFGAVGFGP